MRAFSCSLTFSGDISGSAVKRGGPNSLGSHVCSRSATDIQLRTHSGWNQAIGWRGCAGHYRWCVVVWLRSGA